MQVNKIIATMPKKVQDALQTTIISIGKNGASQYDYVNDILYVAKGADENWNIRDDRMWEFIAEPFREYIVNPKNLEKNFTEFYNLIKEMVE